jgi:hypothetical protein
VPPHDVQTTRPDLLQPVQSFEYEWYGNTLIFSLEAAAASNIKLSFLLFFWIIYFLTISPSNFAWFLSEDNSSLYFAMFVDAVPPASSVSVTVDVIDTGSDSLIFTSSLEATVNFNLFIPPLFALKK